MFTIHVDLSPIEDIMVVVQHCPRVHLQWGSMTLSTSENLGFSRVMA